jgi:hypothetical protein
LRFIHWLYKRRDENTRLRHMHCLSAATAQTAQVVPPRASFNYKTDDVLLRFGKEGAIRKRLIR